MQREEEREMFGCRSTRSRLHSYTPLRREACAAVGRTPQRFDVDTVGRRFDIDSDQPIVDAVQSLPKTAASRWRRSRWPGY